MESYRRLLLPAFGRTVVVRVVRGPDHHGVLTGKVLPDGAAIEDRLKHAFWTALDSTRWRCLGKALMLPEGKSSTLPVGSAGSWNEAPAGDTRAEQVYQTVNWSFWSIATRQWAVAIALADLRCARGNLPCACYSSAQMIPDTRSSWALAAVVVLGAALFGCGARPVRDGTAGGGRKPAPKTEGAQTDGRTLPPRMAVLAEAPTPDVLRVGAGESVVVAQGQVVEGGWFRVAVFGAKGCGKSLGGGTLHAIDLLYDNLTPYPTRLFTSRATVEIVNARGESFPVAGGPLTGKECAPGLALGDGAAPMARLRGWPFAGLPAGGERPKQVRLVLEEPHGFALSTVLVDLDRAPKPAADLPERAQVPATAPSSPFVQVFGEGLRTCTHGEDRWIERVFADAKAQGKELRIVGLDLRLENHSSEQLGLVPNEVVDGDGRAYEVYPTANTSCALGQFPKKVDPASTGRGTAGFALVPVGARRLSVHVQVFVHGKSRYDGYEPLSLSVSLGDVVR